MRARSVLLAWALALPLVAPASEVVGLDAMVPDLSDLPSLQRGATLFLNYCHGCHTLKYQRYERTADDLGIPHELFVQ
ncbi:MAG: cytochrome c1, partial [Pseudomonadales bacterium]